MMMGIVMIKRIEMGSGIDGDDSYEYSGKDENSNNDDDYSDSNFKQLHLVLIIIAIQ